jgi:hypothetical protein
MQSTALKSSEDKRIIIVKATERAYPNGVACKLSFAMRKMFGGESGRPARERRL